MIAVVQCNDMFTLIKCCIFWGENHYHELLLIIFILGLWKRIMDLIKNYKMTSSWSWIRVKRMKLEAQVELNQNARGTHAKLKLKFRCSTECQPNECHRHSRGSQDSMILKNESFSLIQYIICFIFSASHPSTDLQLHHPLSTDNNQLILDGVIQMENIWLGIYASD